MQKPQFYNLGRRGLEWVHDSLESGRTLSHKVFAERKLEDGSVCVVAATSEQHAAATNDKHSLDAATSSSAIVRSDIAASFLLDWLVSRANSEALAFVVEDDLAKPSDPVIRNMLNSVYQVNNDEVMHHKTVRGLKTGLDLEKFFNKSASGYPLNAFVLPQNLLPAPGVLTGDDLNRLAKAVRIIINSAYDGETYTVWTPQESSSP